MKKANKILTIIFLITVIPTIYIYYDHGSVEFNASQNAKSETKATKALGESILFIAIASGYLGAMVSILGAPQVKITYYVILVGTVLIIILYYMRIYGIPVPFTDVIIKDYSTDWRDVVTKICQQIMVIPISMLLARRA